ncbi:spidroin-2-like isoform X2 [Gorilla gorilla gorilla]|uniref:spidroin-2-like isoform X2 n=1 Tax=Gorilla gorilla gorilla TaxID=9595 RepID=UPI0030092062
MALARPQWGTRQGTRRSPGSASLPAHGRSEELEPPPWTRSRGRRLLPERALPPGVPGGFLPVALVRPPCPPPAEAAVPRAGSRWRRGLLGRPGCGLRVEAPRWPPRPRGGPRGRGRRAAGRRRAGPSGGTAGRAPRATLRGGPLGRHCGAGGAKPGLSGFLGNRPPPARPARLQVAGGGGWREGPRGPGGGASGPGSTASRRPASHWAQAGSPAQCRLLQIALHTVTQTANISPQT